MSERQIDWEGFKASVDRAAGRLATKAEELERKAKDGLHRQAIKSRLAEEYEKLGRLTYTRLCAESSDGDSNGDSEGEAAKKIAAVMRNIEKLEAELARCDSDAKD